MKPTKSLLPGKNVPVQCFDIIRSIKYPLSPIENPHKSPFRKFFYDHSKVELFSLLCSNFYKKNLSITRQRKDATAVAQLTLFLNARVSYHKCHTHNKLDAFWYRFTKQVLKFIRCSVCLANWYRKIQLTYTNRYVDSGKFAPLFLHVCCKKESTTSVFNFVNVLKLNPKS